MKYKLEMGNFRIEDENGNIIYDAPLVMNHYEKSEFDRMFDKMNLFINIVETMQYNKNKELLKKFLEFGFVKFSEIEEE